MSGEKRIERINEEILRELSALLPTLKDPRVHGLTSIVRVDTARDLAVAKVYVSVFDADSRPQALEGLKAASGFLRRELAARLDLRHTPALTFVADASLARGAHVLEILNQLKRDEKL